MSALAELCLKAGYKVKGSDQNDSQAVKRLRSQGAEIIQGHDTSLLKDVKTIVYSSAIKDSNIERVYGKELGLTEVHRSDLLSILLSSFKPITVSGTHGKTTTSALISHILEGLGCRPFAAIGGLVNKWNSNCAYGDSNLFVAEVDESDGTLVKYSPYIGIINNIDLDHMDYFRDKSHLIEVFTKYRDNIDKDGCLIVGWDHPISRDLGVSYGSRKLAFGFSLGSDVRAIDYKCENGFSTFKAIVERDIFSCKLKLLGKYNVLNALCALSAVRALELDVRAACELLESFDGVKRRFERIYENEHLKIIDDYAHNPEKIFAVQSAIKQAWPNSDLITFFQPHRYSRSLQLFDRFSQSFSKSDKVILLPVYPAGEEKPCEFDESAFSQAIASSSQTSCLRVSDFSEAVKIVEGNLKNPTIILTVGAGNVWQLAKILKEALL